MPLMTDDEEAEMHAQCDRETKRRAVREAAASLRYAIERIGNVDKMDPEARDARNQAMFRLAESEGWAMRAIGED